MIDNTNEAVIANHKYYAVFKLRMAGWLMLQGYPCHHMDINSKHPDMMVYYFLDTPTLRTYIERYNNRLEVKRYGKC